ncbi:MAG: MG2 domain-containing protein, partial [Myxococcota bacterium]
GAGLLVVQVTDIGLAVRYDLDHVYVLANRLSTGDPAAGVKLTLVDRNGTQVWSTKADEQGFARQPGIRSASDHQAPYVLIAADGDDRAAVVLDGQGTQGYVWAYNNNRLPEEEQVVTHITTDRNIYRPGEMLQAKGIVRRRGSASGVKLLPQEIQEVVYNIYGNRGEPLVEKATAKLSPFGTFAVTFELPRDIALGNVNMSGHVVGGGYGSSVHFSHNIRVEEYRAPEIEVSASLTPNHLNEGQEVQATIEGRYLFGAPVRNGPLSWSLDARPTTFVPPGQDGFHFGAGIHHRWDHHHYRWNAQPPKVLTSGASTLDAQGKLTFKHPFTFPKPSPNDHNNTHTPVPQPMELRLSATVTDSNRQEVSAMATATAHPAAFYTGIKLDRSMVREGESITLSAIAATPKGDRHQGAKLTIKVLRSDMKRTLVQGQDGSYNYTYTSEEVVVGQCDKTSAAEPVTCTVKTEGVGSFTARVTAQDAQGRPVRSEQRFYVTGKGYVPWRQDEGFKVELIPDQTTPYKSGDTARILVKSPFEKAQGLLTVERNGVVEHRVITLEGSASTLEVQLQEAWLPSVEVALTLIRGRVEIEGVEPGQDLGRPAFAHGTTRLNLSTDPKRLTVALKPDRERIAPGETLTVDLEVTDAAGQGQEAEVALFVVDEAVLSLLGYATPDPLATFHTSWGSGTVLNALHNHLIR